jgi:hypothetical protein
MFESIFPAPLPNIGLPNLTAPGSGLLQNLSPADFLAANPRTPGTLTITVGGTITNGDTANLTVTAPFLPGGSVTASASIVTIDTVDSIAQKLAKAINDNAILRRYGVYADSALAVVTVNWPGPLGAFATLTGSVAGGATETLSFTNSGVPTGGSGPIIPAQSFPFSFPGSNPGTSQLVSFYVGQPVLLSQSQVAAMAAAGSPVY